MSIPTSISAYTSELEIWQRALESPRGIEIKAETLGRAKHIRQRLYGARKRQRELHSRIYNPGEPMYGNSRYEELEVTIHGTSVRIARPLALNLEITEL